MKKSFVYLLIAASLVLGIVIGLVSGGLIARKKMSSDLQRFRQGMRRSVIEPMAQKLNLTQEQKDKIKGAIESGRKEAGDISKDTVMKMMAIRDKTNASIRSILTPAQQVEYDKFISQLKNRAPKSRPMGMQAPLENK